PQQQGMLMTLIREYANVQRPELSKVRLEKVKKARLDKVKFAWMGGLEKGQGHYYRIQSATFLIEYDCTQNNANHIHSVWRDFQGDWGADLLALHYHTADHDHGHDLSQTSSDGTLRVDFVENQHRGVETGVALWVYSPRVTNLQTGQVLVDLTAERLWDATAT